MATQRLSGDLIPDGLLTAKRLAVADFLSTGQPTQNSAQLLTVLSARSSPEDNVVGIGIGRKYVAGKATADHCVRFYVAHKLATHAIPTNFEPLRLSRRLPLLRGWSHEDINEVFPRGA